jgi:hypothetical protein
MEEDEDRVLKRGMFTWLGTRTRGLPAGSGGEGKSRDDRPGGDFGLFYGYE